MIALLAATLLFDSGAASCINDVEVERGEYDKYFYPLRSSVVIKLFPICSSLHSLADEMQGYTDNERHCLCWLLGIVACKFC